MSSLNRSLSSILIWAALLTLGSCSSDTSNLSNQRETVNTARKGNTLKVLNRTDCRRVSGGCSQDYMDKLWVLCLQRGWSNSLGTAEVQFSRYMEEYVSGNVDVTIEVPVYDVDKNGVVTSTSRTTNSTDQVNIHGFCVGSEYILK